jgi:hypothetical protein
MSYANKKGLIKDRGGTRSGVDRRHKSLFTHKVERRKLKNRRSGFERRSELGRGRELNLERAVERRDVFRHGDNK